MENYAGKSKITDDEKAILISQNAFTKHTMGCFNRETGLYQYAENSSQGQNLECPLCCKNVIAKTRHTIINGISHETCFLCHQPNQQLDCEFYGKINPEYHIKIKAQQEEQLHTKAIDRIAWILNNETTIHITRHCIENTDCSNQNFSFKLDTSIEVVVKEHTFRHTNPDGIESNRRADVAIVDKNNTKKIIEILHSSATHEENRPDDIPWVELVAFDVNDETHLCDENNNINFICMRRTNCPTCMTIKQKKMEEQQEIDIQTDLNIRLEKDRIIKKAQEDALEKRLELEKNEVIMWEEFQRNEEETQLKIWEEYRLNEVRKQNEVARQILLKKQAKQEAERNRIALEKVGGNYQKFSDDKDRKILADRAKTGYYINRNSNYWEKRSW